MLVAGPCIGTGETAREVPAAPASAERGARGWGASARRARRFGDAAYEQTRLCLYLQSVRHSARKSSEVR